MTGATISATCRWAAEMTSLCMDLDKVLELLCAVETAMAFIDRQRDTETDPESDIGEQVPNRACVVYQELLDAYEAAFKEYDRAYEAQDEWRSTYEYKRQLRIQAQEDAQ